MTYNLAQQKSDSIAPRRFYAGEFVVEKETPSQKFKRRKKAAHDKRKAKGK